ncbi:MAG: response regulator [Bryobacteraceae bacterium]
MAWSVLLVEDHRIVREGIKTILERGAEFRVVGETDSASEAIQLCRKSGPHVVVMDVELPGLNGIDATVEILRHSPETKVVILSMHDTEEFILGALRAGARGFVLKKASQHDLMDALRAVAQGGTWLSPQVSDKLMARIQEGNFSPRPLPAPLQALSRRELQVMRLVAEGKTSKEIATLLDLGLQTVRSYRKTMMRKLRLNNVAALTQLAVSTGLTTLRVERPAAE